LAWIGPLLSKRLILELRLSSAMLELSAAAVTVVKPVVNTLSPILD
jgi:hypothetical protein